MRGQSPVFEQVMLFAVGIAIFMMCLSMFKIYETYFTDITLKDQLNEVRDFIISNILRVSKRGDNHSLLLDIPKTIINQPYEVMLSDKGINVTAMVSGAYAESGLYNLTESFEFSGKIVSSRGKHMIYKKGNEIIIE